MFLVGRGPLHQTRQPTALLSPRCTSTLGPAHPPTPTSGNPGPHPGLLGPQEPLASPLLLTSHLLTGSHPGQ